MSLSATVKSIQKIMRKDVGVDGDAQRIGQLVWLFFLKIWDDREQELELIEDGFQSPLVNVRWTDGTEEQVADDLRWRAWAADPEGMTGNGLLEFLNDTLFPALKNLDPGPRVEVRDDKSRSADALHRRKALVRSVFDDAYQYMKSGTLIRQVVNKVQSGIDFNDSKSRHLFGDVYEQVLQGLQGAGNAGEYYTPRALTQFAVDMINPKLGERIFDPACGTGGFLTCAIEHIRSNEVKTAKQEQELHGCIHGVEKKPLPHLLCTTNMIVHGIDVPTGVRHDNTLSRPLRDITAKDRVDVVVTNPPFGGMEEDGIENNFPTEFRTRETAALFLVLILEQLRPGGRAAIVLPDGTLSGEGVETRIKKRLLAECRVHTIVRLPKGVFSPYTDINTNILFFEKGQATEEVWFYEHPYPPGYKSYSKTKPILIEEFEPEKAWWDRREETDRAWRVPIKEIQDRGFNLDFKNPRAPRIALEDPDLLLSQFTAKSKDASSLRARLASRLSGALRHCPPDTLSAWSRIADNIQGLFTTPDDLLPLRDAVLRLAVSGSLVEQDPGEGSGKDLVAKIATARAELIANGEVPRPRALKGNGSSAVQKFDVPDGWAWGTLDDVAAYIQRGKSPKYDDESPVSVVSQKCVQWSGFDITRARGVAESSLCKYGLERYLRGGDLLWNSTGTGTVGRVNVYPEDISQRAVADSHVTIVRLLHMSPQFTFLWLSSPFVQSKIDELTTGSTKQQELNASTVRLLHVPIPPLQEQRRIVASVEELLMLLQELGKVLRDEAKLRVAASTSAVSALSAPTGGRSQMKAASSEMTALHSR